MFINKCDFISECYVTLDIFSVHPILYKGFGYNSFFANNCYQEKYAHTVGYTLYMNTYCVCVYLHKCYTIRKYTNALCFLYIS